MKRQPVEPFPWDDVLEFGLMTLRLAPRDLWLLTPREIALCVDTRQPKQFLSRDKLTMLMNLFPDGGGFDDRS